MSIDRVLIVGHGSIGKLHLRIARSLLPEADIRVLRHRGGAVPEYANGCMSSVEEAEAYEPQAAVIANPANFHIQFARRLAEFGANLLVEKPLAASLDGISELLATCIARNLVLMTAYNLRFLPSLKEYRRQICSGVIGRVISVRCDVGQYLPSWRPGTDYRAGVSASSNLGGGVLLELSHEIDYLRWIFGEVSWVRAVLSKQSSLDVDVEDTAHLILGFETGADGRKLIANLNMDFARHDSTRQCIAVGERGSLRWNGLTGTVELYPAGGSGWLQLFCNLPQRDESYVAEWQHYLACIRDKKTMPVVSGYDGLAVLQIIDAARLSSASNDNVLVTSIGGKK